MRLPGRACRFGLLLLWASALAGANGITNGDFSDGLNGWTVTSGTVTDGGGHALLAENAAVLLSSLEQQFVMPEGISKLAFYYEMVSAVDPGELTGGPADAFIASLLDAGTLLPILSTPGYPDFFYLADTGFMDFDPAIVTVSGGLVTLDLTSVMALIQGTQVILAFDLLGFYDGAATQVRVDNVALIPEPATLTLLALGGLGLLHRRRRRA